ncbi:MAG: squalene/phytoene synthase family protein [Pseudomonadota bacterium]
MILSPLPKDLFWCRDIAAKGRSNLWLSARALSTHKRDIFDVSYATMRLADDWVDQGTFAKKGLSPVLVDKILKNQFATTSKNMIESKNTIDCRSAQTKEALDLTKAFKFLFDQVCLDRTPWFNLMHCLQNDVQKKKIKDWDDFDHYVLGVASAPACCFLQILLSNKAVFSKITDELHCSAHQMAKYCYLVHILRDLKKDAEQDAQLLTLPYQFIQNFDIYDHDELARLICTEQTDCKFNKRLQALCDGLLKRIKQSRIKAIDACRNFIEYLQPVEANILQFLVASYIDIEKYLKFQPDLPVKPDAQRLEKRRADLYNRYFKSPIACV